MRKLFLILFTVVSFGMYGQNSHVTFAPIEADAALKARSFYKNEVVLHVEKSEFKNGNNYITLYLINGSEKPLNIMAAFGEKAKNVVSGLLLYHTQKEAPYDLIYDLGKVNPGKKETEPVSSPSIASINTFCMEEALYPGYYIKQTLKIPCAGCTKANKITARFTFEEGNGNLLNYYFSNGFEMYHNGESLPKKEVQNIEPIRLVNLMVGAQRGDFIHTKDLPYLDGQVLTDVTLSKLKGYELLSMALVVVPKTGDAEVFHIAGNKLNEKALERIKALRAGDRIIIDQIKAKSSGEGLRNLIPAVYTIIDDDYRTSLFVGNSRQISLGIKTLALLSETEVIRIGDEHTEAGFSIKGYKLEVISGISDSWVSKYTSEGNALPAEALKEIKALPVASILTFSEIMLVNKETGETKILEPTTYKLVE